MVAARGFNKSRIFRMFHGLPLVTNDDETGVGRKGEEETYTKDEEKLINC